MGLIIRNGKKLESPNGEGIVKTCEEFGVLFACEDGQCGTCEIQVVRGMENLTPKTKHEDYLITNAKNRLACQCKLTSGEVEIKIVGDDIPKE